MPTRAPRSATCAGARVRDATFYGWKKRYAYLGVSELHRPRQLEEEHSWLKRLGSDLLIDKHILLEALRKKSEARLPPGTRRVVSGHVPGAVL